MLRLSRSDMAWLAGQVVLFLLAFVILPRLDGGPGRVALDAARPIGVAIMGLGVVVLVIAFATLGRQLVPQPTPIEGGELVDHGIYGLVRHPIYTGVLLLIVGGLVRTPSISGLLVIVASWAFFDAKSAHEERLLSDRYPTYQAYRQRTRYKVMPGIR
ncbi:methyltransferase family protein [Euzebya tangerina]|uniref:methyltransferase family protein n=1 Tax=Euzebya tangerina TaxID=591198 RepID=UPI000E31C4BC|nr:isoprenylcysteine carboxylmethyltransferase family protein [Euzebya tangerina]